MTTVKASRSKKLSRAPGQFLAEERERFLEWGVLYILIIGATWGLVFIEVLNWYTKEKTNPWYFVLIAIPVTMFSLIRLACIRQKMRNFSQGIQGERMVADFLWEHVVPKGYFLLNDITVDFGNIDHVLVGPNGVFCIETKMLSKLEGQRNDISVEGGYILVNGARLNRPDPIQQVTRLSRTLEELISKRTQIKVCVNPIVVFPECWFENCYIMYQGVRVLNPAYIRNFVLKYCKQTLDESAIRNIHQGLKDYVKDQRGNE